MRYLYLAEKPSAMKSVKAAYNASNKPLGDIDFFALAGHICRLCEPKEYEDWDVKWADRKLPMIPNPFRVGILTDNKVKDLKEQLKKVKYDAIIVGTDSDVEGNGIYDLIETYLGLQNYKTYRFFESDLTPAGIMKSMNNLTDYHTNPRDVGMTQSFRIRSRFDWLIGFNMTVAYTVKSGFLMKVGRVKAPTLKLVYDNCKAIDGFSSKTAYQPAIVTENPEVAAYMIDDEGKAVSYADKNEAQKVLTTLSGEAEVLSFEKTAKKTQPDQLYKLTDIQVEAGSKYGYTPEKTLELIQSLYERHKLISYPRTDGRYVSTEKSKDFARLLKAVEAMPSLSAAVKTVTPEAIAAAQGNKRFVNDVEVQKSSHDALIPTGDTAALGNLTMDEMHICEMIFKRFLAIFFPPLEEEKTKAVLTDNNIKFSCTGSKVVNPGFTVLTSKPKETPLPDFKKGQKLKEKEKSLHEIISKAPARFTQATLIKAMENVQKYMAADETELKKALKKAGGIGQPSSRAAIISELVSTGYIDDVKSGKGKGLHITDSGKRYIENLGSSSIVSPELSAQWEVYMNDIREGTKTYDEVYEKVIDYVYQALKELEGMEIQKVTAGNRKEVGKCPKCGKPVVALPKGYGCSGYPDCDFSVFKRVAGTDLTDKDMADMLNGKAKKHGGNNMSRGRKKSRKVINPLVEHIADYSDMEFVDNESGEALIASHAQAKIDKKCEDETDRMWMYKDNRDDEIVDEDESTEDDLWSDEDKKEKERKKSEKGTAQVEQKVNAVAEEKVKQYMDAAVWFKDISERGEMTEKEQRYVELMIIELSKFYFSNLDTLHPSSKCRESICKIFEDIRRAGMC